MGPNPAAFRGIFLGNEIADSELLDVYNEPGVPLSCPFVFRP